MALRYEPLAGVACWLGAVFMAVIIIGGTDGQVEYDGSDTGFVRSDIPDWKIDGRERESDAVRPVSVGGGDAPGVVDPEPYLAAPAPEPGGTGSEPTASPAVVAFTPATDIERIVCSYSWDCGTALRVMYCESGGRPDAIGNGVNFGLFQINAVHSSHWAGFWEHWYEPAWNVGLAYEIWTVRGWRPWACW